MLGHCNSVKEEGEGTWESIRNVSQRMYELCELGFNE